MRLEVVDFAGPARWRWRLTDPFGAFVADHDVELDVGAWEFEAFTDLHDYLRWKAVPDRRQAHEAELVTAVGDWITAQVLGPVADKLARARGAVRLDLPAEAAVLGYRPWELARVAGRTLAGHRVSFVVDQQPHHPMGKNPVGERLRMLAVFSLPEGAGALNLRKERHELTRLIRQIAKVNNKAVELRVLQYGVTRARLEDALLERPGWDVVHVSGHGLAGGLVLETDSGERDLITSPELVDLLDLGGDQIKLVTLSACESAAVTATGHLHQLGLAALTPPVRDTEQTAEVLPAVAAALVERLDCAVLAMRYPVVDDFAIGLAEGFYNLLLGKGQPVTRALSLTLPRITATTGAGAPALSVGTPVLFGARATDLVLTPPPGGPTEISVDGQTMAGFPPQPDRFVGRVGPMTRATTALAPESGRTGVVFHGMAGGGKTACALELAYTHQGTFPGMVWFAAPPEGHDITAAAAGFALAVEHQVGLRLAHLLADPDSLCATLPALTEVMEQQRLLIVIDNAESLLTPSGAWRDERWQRLVHALTAHRGLSRLVLTSRTRPADLPGSMLVEPVHALSLRETVLLAREWPHLATLVDATPPPAGMSADQARALAARTLQVVQGHPKLIELADGHARNPWTLAARLDQADTTWLTTGTRLDTFIQDGESAATDHDFLTALQGWTRAATTTLPTESALLFHLLCCLEEPDRDRFVVDAVWPAVWQYHPTHPTPEHPPVDTPDPLEPPDLDTTLAPPIGQALVATTSSTVTTEPDGGPAQEFRIHPGVADTGRTTTDPDLAAAVDTLTGDFWLNVMQWALEREHEQQTGGLVVRAARSAGPYLLRGHRWDALDTVAEELLDRDHSTAAAAALLPMLTTAADATHGSDDELDLGRTHARALTRLDPDRGETRLRQLLHTTLARERFTTARSLTGDLIALCVRTGRLDEALTLAETLPALTRRAGLGPWTRLGDQGQRLQILHLQGRNRQVLDEVLAMRETWAGLPDPPEADDTGAVPWNVRETTLNLGSLAATDLRLSAQALELNAENLDSMRRRGASEAELARDSFNDYGPLLWLGRVVEARDLLHRCRAVYEADDDIRMLGKTLGALADIEENLGHRDLSITLGTDALRYNYLAADPQAIGISHHNLADILQRDGRDPRQVWAHHLAAAVIRHQTGDGLLANALRAIASLSGSDPDARPDRFDEVITIVEQIPGVRLGALLDRLRRGTPDNQTAMTAVLQLATQAGAEHTARLVELWDPMLAALWTARHDPDPDTRHAAGRVLDQALTVQEGQPGWAELAGRLRRLHTGAHDPARDPAPLLAGLDDIDTAITRRALDVLTHPDGPAAVGIDPDTWHHHDESNGDVEAFLRAIVDTVAAAAGGDTGAQEQVGPVLQQMATDPDWAPLATALGRVIDLDPTPVDGITPDHSELLAAVRIRLHPPAEDQEPPMTHPEPVRRRIAALPDDRAVAVLALVLARQGHTVDPFTHAQQQEQLRQALTQPDIVETVTPIPHTSDGDLARTALTHLLGTDPTTAHVIDHAIHVAPTTERDPTQLLLTGSLVLLAFQSDIELARHPDKGWTFRFRKKGLADSTIGRLLGQLLGNILTPPGPP